MSAIGPILSAAAALGVAYRKHWSRWLVLLLVVLFVGTWIYWISVAAISGFYRTRPLQYTIISLIPGSAFCAVAVFCVYVVLLRLRPRPTET